MPRNTKEGRIYKLFDQMHFSMRTSIGCTPVWSQIPQLSTSGVSYSGPSKYRARPNNIHQQETHQHSSTSSSPPPQEINQKKKENKPFWMIQKEALRRNFPEGWNPPKKISRPSMILLRTLHKTDPLQFSLPVLAHKFKISPEAVRRILKSKWQPSQDQDQEDHDHDQDRGSEKGSENKASLSSSSSDGWVHHEKLETNQIPVNLAQAIQSSPSSTFPKQSPNSKNHSGFQRKNNFMMIRSHEKKLVNEVPNKKYELGSAFDQPDYYNRLNQK